MLSNHRNGEEHVQELREILGSDSDEVGLLVAKILLRRKLRDVCLDRNLLLDRSLEG